MDPFWGMIVIVAWAMQRSMWFSLFPGGPGKATVYLSVSLSTKKGGKMRQKRDFMFGTIKTHSYNNIYYNTLLKNI